MKSYWNYFRFVICVWIRQIRGGIRIWLKMCPLCNSKQDDCPICHGYHSVRGNYFPAPRSVLVKWRAKYRGVIEVKYEDESLKCTSFVFVSNRYIEKAPFGDVGMKDTARVRVLRADLMEKQEGEKK